jgi:hypothetical protein
MGYYAASFAPAARGGALDAVLTVGGRAAAFVLAPEVAIPLAIIGGGYLLHDYYYNSPQPALAGSRRPCPPMMLRRSGGDGYYGGGGGVSIPRSGDNSDGPCEEHYLDDQAECLTARLRGGKAGQARCLATAATRYGECRSRGGPQFITTPPDLGGGRRIRL